MKKTVLQHKILIHAPHDFVFAEIANLENAQHFTEEIKNTVYVSENRTGIGAARQCTMKNGEQVIERVTAWKDGEFIAMEMAKSNMPVKYMNWVTKVEPRGNNTWVYQTLQYEMQFGIFGIIMNHLMVKGVLNRLMEDIFENMKSHFEGLYAARHGEIHNEEKEHPITEGFLEAQQLGQ